MTFLVPVVTKPAALTVAWPAVTTAVAGVAFMYAVGTQQPSVGEMK